MTGQLNDAAFENLEPVGTSVLLEEGVYPARWLSWHLRKYRFGEKVIFEWEVYPNGDQKEKHTLQAFYNAKYGPTGGLQFGPRHSYRKDWIAANRGRWPPNPRNLSLSVWGKGLFWVKVMNVCEDQKGAIHPGCYWSKVNGVIRPVDESENLDGLPRQRVDFRPQ